MTWAWRSYVAATLWAWFAVPIGAPYLTVARTMGLGLIVNCTVHRVSYADAEAEKRMKDKSGEAVHYAMSIVLAVIGPLLVLGFGWLYKQFL